MKGMEKLPVNDFFRRKSAGAGNLGDNLPPESGVRQTGQVAAPLIFQTRRDM